MSMPESHTSDSGCVTVPEPQPPASLTTRNRTSSHVAPTARVFGTLELRGVSLLIASAMRDRDGVASALIRASLAATATNCARPISRWKPTPR